MKTQHTPGEWKLKFQEDDGDFPEPTVFNEDYGTLAFPYDSWLIYVEDGNDEAAKYQYNISVADMKLMAAAPSLLACAIEISKFKGFQPEEDYGKRLLAAIKKATE